MYVSLAPELNGARITIPGAPEVWLILHGVRRHICSPAVYNAMFEDTDDLVSMPSVDHIQRGADLNEGTILARSEGGGGVYLITGWPESEVLKHLIASYETFLIYGFDEGKIKDVPALVLAGVPGGLAIHCG